MKKGHAHRVVRPKNRGRKSEPKNLLAETVDRSEKENRKLRLKLKQAEAIIANSSNGQR